MPPPTDHFDLWSVLVTAFPWLVILGFAVFLFWANRRAQSYVGGDRRGRIPAVINPDGRIPDTTVVASQPVPAYEAVYHGGSSDHPVFLTITVFLPTALDFLITRREDQSHGGRLLRAGTICATSGDEAFDRQFEVRSIVGSRVLAAVLKSQGVRKLIEALFAMGFNMVRSDGKSLDANWYKYPFTAQVEPTLLQTAVGYLQELAEAIQQAVPEPEPIAQLGVLARTTLLGAIPILVTIPLSMFWKGGEPIYPAPYWLLLTVAVGLLPALLLGAVIHRVIKRRPHSSTGRLVVIFASIMSSYFLGDVILRFLNSKLDRGPVARHVQRVVGWREGGTSTYLEVTPWDDSLKCARIPVSYSDCERAKRHGFGDFTPLGIEVIARPGFLGFEWVESYKLLPTRPVEMQD